MRHLLDVDDLSPAELRRALDLAELPDPPAVLRGASMALLFEKPSLRTRHSMERAVAQLGGQPVTSQAAEIGLGRRESVEDVTRTLAGYHAAVGARVFHHDTVRRMAAVDVVPIVNLLSDVGHPMQALADLLTLRQVWGGFDGRSVAFVGDANNVCRSFVTAAAMLGLEVRVGSPHGYGFGSADLERFAALGCAPRCTEDPVEAVDGVDAVYADTWISMGQEDEAAARRATFVPYRVDAALMAHARPGAGFLHCLPAHRGEEVTDEVLDAPTSLVWRQAENRMHAARGVLAVLLAGDCT
ncbi:MAG: ornithine carbamoyltransferase [Actinobacteria bacterium]|nr:ornithine carbamoyltransferase [Actinomycetota bacterium]